MVGYRAKEFLENISLIFSEENISNEENLIETASKKEGKGYNLDSSQKEKSSNSDSKQNDKPIHKVVVQLGLTLFIVILCLYVSVNPNSSEIAQKLAFAGFGIVFGYWFG
ncbi:MAG: hypothetical protein MUC29_11955 [Pyrinomonadaceae bacterium]|jgi:hypothetical protein|nr:hypothetical protein [Pyrinomonadaceae bacterium]